MPTVLISSTNYNGQYGDITFFPDTGGTFNLGYQLIPYYYVADYVYGNYDVFFSAFNKTCQFDLTSSGVTPTPTVCSSDQFTITNNTVSPITVDNVTSPFTNVSLPQFTLSAFTGLIVCSCTTPTTSGGSVTNNGPCPNL